MVGHFNRFQFQLQPPSLSSEHPNSLPLKNSKLFVLFTFCSLSFSILKLRYFQSFTESSKNSHKNAFKEVEKNIATKQFLRIKNSQPKILSSFSMSFSISNHKQAGNNFFLQFLFTRSRRPAGMSRSRSGWILEQLLTWRNATIWKFEKIRYFLYL